MPYTTIHMCRITWRFSNPMPHSSFCPVFIILEDNERSKPTTIENVQSLTLMGNDIFVMDTSEIPVPSSHIHCNGSGGLLFTAVNGLFIGNLMFSTYGAVLPWPFNGRFQAVLTIILDFQFHSKTYLLILSSF